MTSSRRSLKLVIESAAFQPFLTKYLIQQHAEAVVLQFFVPNTFNFIEAHGIEPPRQAEQVAGGNATLWAWGKVQSLDYFQRSRKSRSRVPQ